MKNLLYICIVLLCCTTAKAQIPNANFELWDTFATYKSPKYWDNLDSATKLTSVFTCERDSPSVGPNYYLKLTSKTVPLVGVAPGVAVSGKIDFSSTSYGPKSGFAFTSRPKSLTGMHQFMQFGSDHGFMMVLLSKWNTTTSKRDTVAYGNLQLPGMEMAWKAFSFDLKYYSGVNPDSAIIILSASGKVPADKDFLYVDSLAFAGSVPVGSITLNSATTSVQHSSVSVFPNPATGYTNINCYSNTTGAVNITISDLNGRIVDQINNETSKGNNDFRVNTSGYAPGIYLIKVATGQDAEVVKLVIQ